MQKNAKKIHKKPQKSKNYQKWSENLKIWKNLKNFKKIFFSQKISKFRKNLKKIAEQKK